MTPISFKGVTTVLGAPPDWNEAEHGTCVGLPIMQADGVCTSKWKLTLSERLTVLFNGAVFCHIVSGHTQPPVDLTVSSDKP